MFNRVCLNFEGSKVNVPPKGGRKHPDQKYIEVDTTNILFVAGGAFVGIEKKIGSRLNSASLGYSKETRQHVEEDEVLSYITPSDLKSFGLIPELIGRMPIVTFMSPLDKKALRAILTLPKNALVKQYQHLFHMDDIALSFDEEVYDYIVEIALEYSLGARGLRSVCEAILTDHMFDAPGLDAKEIHITLEYAKSQIERSSFEKHLKAVSISTDILKKMIESTVQVLVRAFFLALLIMELVFKKEGKYFSAVRRGLIALLAVIFVFGSVLMKLTGWIILPSALIGGTSGVFIVRLIQLSVPVRIREGRLIQRTANLNWFDSIDLSKVHKIEVLPEGNPRAVRKALFAPSAGIKLYYNRYDELLVECRPEPLLAALQDAASQAGVVRL